MKKKSKLITATSIFLAVVILITSLIYRGEWDLKVTKYTVENEKITTPFRIVLLADLHMREYGKKNGELLEIIRAQEPDIIAVAGDMVNKNSKETGVAIDLFKELCKITDVYFCLGNHELSLDIKLGTVFDEMEKTGAIYLDNEQTEAEVNGQKIVVGGLSSYPDYGTQNYAFVTEFEKQECFKLLLCHYPEYYPNTLENYKLDLILSGHAHGGQIRIPGIGGVFAPEQGFWPKYTKGVYSSKTATMIVTAGLGDSNVFPRINNPPELVVIDVK